MPELAQDLEWIDLLLRFILGRAGSGKTRRCLDEIRQQLRRAPEGPPLVFLVPEQATFQTEYALVSTPDLAGTVRARVLSFRRLAWLVLAEAGGAAQPLIGDLGKRMIIARILESRRSELRVFGRAARQFGFAGNMVRTLSELKAYLVTPADLERAGSRVVERSGAHILGAKLQDLKLVYAAFEAYLAGRYVDPDDYLTLSAARLAESRLLDGAEVWVDGFAGFTPQEYQVLEVLLRRAARVNVALCLDPDAKRREDRELFRLTRETHTRLAELARKNGVRIEALKLNNTPPPRFQNSPALAHLERQFFRRPTAVYRGAAEVKLVAAENQRAEVEGAAREIIRLCRERGYRWREVSVIVRHLDDYHEILATVFTDYGIPFFIDRKRTVLHHPLVELIRSALQTVTDDWAYDPVFRFLKTDLAPVSREEVDLLENYVLAHGIRGNRWVADRDWAYRPSLRREGEEPAPAYQELLRRVNEVRRRASRQLLAFHRRLNAAEKVRDMAAAVYDLLAELKVPDQLEAWSLEAEADGLLEAAREHRQVWDGVIQLLDQLVEALGDDHLPLGEFMRILDAGLEGLQLALIPPALDQVFVGALDRSRNPDVRAAFVLGVSDGVLPARQVEGGLFSDREREMLSAAGVELAPDSRRRAYEEQYLVYIALTRSSEYLWLSYPLADPEGRACQPSSVIFRLRAMFPEVAVEMVPVQPRGVAAGEDLAFVSVPQRTLGYLAVRLRDWMAGCAIDPVWWAVYNWFSAQNGGWPGFSLIRRGLFHENQERPLGPETCTRLYGSPLVVSVTSVESFQACPFAHFARYGLRLKERPVFRLEAPDLGQFFHAALQALEEQLKAQSLDWAALGPEDCRRLAGAVVDRLAPLLQNEILLSTPRYRFLTGKLSRVVARTAWALSAQARKSRFRPVAWELSFGRGGKIGPLVYELPGGTRVELAGRIDRIDAASTDSGDTYLRVIDYKAGNPALRLDDVFYGLNLQLLVYLEAALANAGRIVGRHCLPGGVFYSRVQNPLLRKKAPVPPAEVEQDLLRAFRLQGLILDDPEVLRLMDATAGGESSVVPAGFRGDGSLRRKPNVLGLAHFQRLREHLARTVTEAGRRIGSGEVAIAPFRKGRRSACTHCPYKPLCAFDPLVAPNRYRLLPAVAASEIWRALGLPEEGCC